MERVDVMGTCSRCGKNWNELAQRFGADRPEETSPSESEQEAVSFQDCPMGSLLARLP